MPQQMVQDPSVTEVGLAEARMELSTIVNRTAFGGEKFVVTSHGKPRAALIPIEDLERLLELEYQLKAEATPT